MVVVEVSQTDPGIAGELDLLERVATPGWLILEHFLGALLVETVGDHHAPLF